MDSTLQRITAPFYRSFRSLFLSASERLVRTQPTRELRCLYAHHVFDDQRESFAELIDELSDIGTFVGTEKFLGILDGSHPLDDRYFFLSFDDGFEGVVTNALPVLEKHDVPAAFFVPTDYVGASKRRAEAFAFEAGYDRELRFATWDQLRRASDSLVEIGAHTKSHARLSDLSDPDELAEEITGSKARIEEMLGTECRLFSWPYGTADDVSNQAIEEIRNAGFDACLSGIRGSVVPGETKPFRVPREHFEADWPTRHVRFFARGLADQVPFI